MFAILSEGALLALCEKPRYVKVNEETGAYVEAPAEEAVGLAVDGQVYNLPGGTAISGAAEVVIQEADAPEYVFRNRARILLNEETTGAAIVSMEEALCELDAASEEKMAAVEEALCELDSVINGGGEN